MTLFRAAGRTRRVTSTRVHGFLKHTSRVPESLEL